MATDKGPTPKTGNHHRGSLSRRNRTPSMTATAASNSRTGTRGGSYMRFMLSDCSCAASTLACEITPAWWSPGNGRRSPTGQCHRHGQGTITAAPASGASGFWSTRLV